MTSQNEIKVSAEIGSNEKKSFDFPFLQMVAAYTGEIIFTIFYYLYKAFLMRAEVKSSEINFSQFAYPAVCDFTENLLFIFGLTKVLPSLSMMTKAIALPISALICSLSLLKIRKSFNAMQIWTLVAICVSATLVLVANYDASEE